MLRVLRDVSNSSCAHPQVRAFQAADVQAEIVTVLQNSSLFFNSEDAGQFPRLRSLLASMRLAFSAERRIEGKHAASKKGIVHAPHHSTPYVSLLRRLPGIEKGLSGPDELKVFARHISEVRSGRVAVIKLGLPNHPHCCVARTCRDPAFTSIIYHADSFSKYRAPAPLLLPKPLHSVLML